MMPLDTECPRCKGKGLAGQVGGDPFAGSAPAAPAASATPLAPEAKLPPQSAPHPPVAPPAPAAPLFDTNRNAATVRPDFAARLLRGLGDILLYGGAFFAMSCLLFYKTTLEAPVIDADGKVTGMQHLPSDFLLQRQHTCIMIGVAIALVGAAIRIAMYLKQQD
jgi:hypothetical protein